MRWHPTSHLTLTYSQGSGLSKWRMSTVKWLFVFKGIIYAHRLRERRFDEHFLLAEFCGEVSVKKLSGRGCPFGFSHWEQVRGSFVIPLEFQKFFEQWFIFRLKICCWSTGRNFSRIPENSRLSVGTGGGTSHPPDNWIPVTRKDMTLPWPHKDERSDAAVRPRSRKQ